jgi:hypothetical protein
MTTDNQDHQGMEKRPQQPSSPSAGSASELERLRSALHEIMLTSEQYNHIGWHRIVGVMRRLAEDALKPNDRTERPARQPEA